MPIRINLLAEQQAAEEARRRDPVKRALWVGGGLVAVMLLWIMALQFRVTSAKASLTSAEAKLQSVEENSKEARSDWATAAQLESRIANLRRYSTNRFFSAEVLDALQQVVSDDVRVMELQTAHAYSTNAPFTLRTNFVFPIATRSAWQFWKARPGKTNVLASVTNQIAAITGKVEAFNTPVELITKVDVVTNSSGISAAVEITKPATASEQVVLTIRARDYANPPGGRVDEFSKAIASHPYFAQRLREGDGQGIRLRERAIQPELDPTDPISPGRPFVPFVIECRYRENVRANE